MRETKHQKIGDEELDFKDAFNKATKVKKGK